MAGNKGTFTRSSVILLGLLLSDIALASPTEQLTKRNHGGGVPPAAANDTPPGVLNCETERSSDYYGLGVRLGIYFAWFQAWIANVAVPSEIKMAQQTNTIFLFAVLCAMIRCAVSGLLLQMDGLLLMHISGGTIFSVLSLWGYRTCSYNLKGPAEGIKKFGSWGTHFKLLLSMGISVFGFFFWVWGIKGALYADPNPDCHIVYTFFFSKLRADGGIRYMYIIICAGCMLYFGVMLLASLIGIPARFNRWQKAYHEGNPGQLVHHQFATGLNQGQLRRIFYFLRIGNFVFIIYSMLLVEFTLNYNHVSGVLGWQGHVGFPSQIIPMIIGIFGFVHVLWVAYQQWKPTDPHHNSNRRSILSSTPKEIIKMYTPKSNASYKSADSIEDSEMDPQLKGQALWLRLLVSWLPWLCLIRWWRPAANYDQDGDDGDNENDPAMSSRLSGGFSAESTPREASFSKRETWRSDTTLSETPQIPQDVLQFRKL